MSHFCDMSAVTPFDNWPELTLIESHCLIRPHAMSNTLNYLPPTVILHASAQISEPFRTKDPFFDSWGNVLGWLAFFNGIPSNTSLTSRIQLTSDTLLCLSSALTALRCRIFLMIWRYLSSCLMRNIQLDSYEPEGIAKALGLSTMKLGKVCCFG